MRMIKFEVFFDRRMFLQICTITALSILLLCDGIRKTSEFGELDDHREHYDSLDNYEVESDLSIPHGAQTIKRAGNELSKEISSLLSGIRRLNKNPFRDVLKYVDERSLCYCNYDSEYCGGFSNRTCFKHIEAACFHFTEEVYNSVLRRMETLHLFGCAPLSHGSGGSYFTCKAHLMAHARPQSIACCYEGSYCNENLTLPTYTNVSPEGVMVEQHISSGITAILTIFSISGLSTLVILLFVWWKREFLIEKLKPIRLPPTDVSCVVEKSAMLSDMSSGSGSGFASLNQRTIAQNLQFLVVIGRGRYGEVKKALYRGDRLVAVKTFYTTEEDSWKNEKEIYQTQMLNNENILQFVAADIGSEDSITRMLLITDYHEFGSLFQYLNRGKPLSVYEALHLACSAACGIEHLHSAVKGTGSTQKPAIAHRDIKSKNIIVKRPGVCCIADFGLALSSDTMNEKAVINIQVGTKRYMAPEILNKTLNPKNFHHFKMADVYSFALVIWEILRRIENEPIKAGMRGSDSGIGYSGGGSSVTSAKNYSSVYSIDSWNNVDSKGNISPATADVYLIEDLSPRCSPDMLTVNAWPTVQPYDGLVDTDPSYEQMRYVVCIQKKRPFLEESWMHDACLSEICTLMRECWCSNTESRHTALRIKKTIKETIKKHPQARNFRGFGAINYEEY